MDNRKDTNKKEQEIKDEKEGRQEGKQIATRPAQHLTARHGRRKTTWGDPKRR
jgi:hypothetical protein